MEKKNKFLSFTKIWFLIYLVITLAFAGIVMYMNILPQKYLVILGAALLIVSLIIAAPMCMKKFGKKTRIPAFIISLILMAVYITGAVYIVNTLDFMDRITNTNRTQTEDYYVIVDKESSYEAIKDIEGKVVSTYTTTDPRYAEAIDALKKEVNTGFDAEESLSVLSGKLLDKEVEIIFISKLNYDAIREDLDDFAEKTKIIYTVELKIENNQQAKNVDVTTKPFNVMITGLDTEGTIDVLSRSDVNMIMTVNPVTHEILLTSIPRDYYVQLPGKGNARDKLTHTGIYGVSETIATVEQLMGIEINYYVKVNYTTVTQLVDAIGGITVDSDFDFTTHGMATSYSFSKGENYLDGAKALAFARERKSFASGDLQRNKNQQKVLKGILKKTLSSETILMNYTSMLSALSDYVELNMSKQDMQALVKMQLNSMPKWTINQQSVEGTTGSEMCYSLGDFYASIVYVDDESVAKASEEIKKVSAEE